MMVDTVSNTATTSGIMALESSWVVLAHLKTFLLHTLTDLAREVKPGGVEWMNAIKSMSTWGRDVLTRYVDTTACTRDYQRMVLAYMGRSTRGRIANIGYFLETFVKLASRHPLIMCGGYISCSSLDQDHTVTDLLRTTLSTVTPHEEVKNDIPHMTPDDSVSVAITSGGMEEDRMSEELDELTRPKPPYHSTSDGGGPPGKLHNDVTGLFLMQQKGKNSQTYSLIRPTNNTEEQGYDEFCGPPDSMAQTAAGR